MKAVVLSLSIVAALGVVSGRAAAATPVAQSASATKEPGKALSWKVAEGVKIPVPPAEHPRLYLRAEQVRQLPARLEDPVLQPVVKKLAAQANGSAQARVEWDAVRYLATKDRTLGRETVERALGLLHQTELPDRLDACRVTGRMMVTGAIVYDWLYELLTREEKEAFIAELIRLAKTQECGYPPTRQGSVTGHSSEAMIMRDMLSAGIAVYDEYPEMYDLAAGRFFREHLPVRNWFYNGHAYHQGDSYGVHRYSWDTYPLWIFDRLGAGNVFNPEQRYVPYLWIYATRPDGQRLRAGDTFCDTTSRGRPWSEFMGTLLTASYYGDGVLLGQFLRQGGSGGNEMLFEFLWRDTALRPAPINALPLSRYFGSPFGWMIARTGWDDRAAIAEMKINETNFVNHQHLDAGAFQIYYKGPLAIDSGLYSGSSGEYGSPHCKNYYWRTIAHNSLLIHDPAEVFGREGSGFGNDGGQRLPNGRSEAPTLEVLQSPAKGYRTGKVLAQGFGPDATTPAFTFLEGDITAAYGPKVRQVVRSFVFLNLRDDKVPAALVVFDRVVTADPKFQKSWLLHSLEEPTLEASSAMVQCTEHGDRGRLTLDVLSPTADNLELGKVGGPGREFWVFGQNYANDIEPDKLARSSREAGAWRVEVSPKKAAAADLFLTVMQVTDRQTPGRLPVHRIDAPDCIGCVLEGPDGFWAVVFPRDSRASDEQVAFTVAGSKVGRYLVTGLIPGKWRARCEASQEVREIEVSDPLHAAWFEGPPGTWTLKREGAAPDR
ncbi:MAG: heparin/heparin-sulfate lyase HepB [Pirellulales bacterium]